MKKRMLSIIMAVLMLSALLTTAAYAAGGDFDGLHWEYADGALTITGTGSIPDYPDADVAPWSVYNGYISSVTVAEGVQRVGNNAFAGSGATTVTLPKTTQTIGSNALPSALTSITAPCTLASSLPAVNQTLIHSPVEVPQKDATYTETGMKKHWKCSGCNKLFADSACSVETTETALIIPRLDSEAPTLVSLVTDRDVVSPPNTVNVTVTADDKGLSGVGGGSVTFTNLAKTGTPSVSCVLSPNGSLLTGALNIADTLPSGDYYISSLTLTDKANNSRTYTYSTLDPAFKNIKLTIKRASAVNTLGSLSLNATTVGYGGTVTGTVILKDANGLPLQNRNLDIYVGTLKTTIAATTDASGTATFKYSNTIPGTYTLKAVFLGDEDYNACETNMVSVTFTSVPATGDSYDVLLWVCVGVLAIGVNAWFFIRRKKA